MAFEHRLRDRLLKTCPPDVMTKLLEQAKRHWKKLVKDESVVPFLHEFDTSGPSEELTHELLFILLWYSCRAAWNDGGVRDHLGKKRLLQMRIKDADVVVKPVGLNMKIGYDKDHVHVADTIGPHTAVSWLAQGETLRLAGRDE